MNFRLIIFEKHLHALFCPLQKRPQWKFGKICSEIVDYSVHRVVQAIRHTVNYTYTFTIMEMWTLLSKLEGGKVLRLCRESIEKIVKI